MADFLFPSVSELVQNSNRRVKFTKEEVKVLSDQVEDLLDYAIFQAGSSEGSRAMSIFVNSSVVLVSSASESGFFLKRFAEVLALDASPDDHRISSFATVCECCLSHFPSDLLVSFKFFNRFLVFAENLSVLYMFKSLLKYEEAMAPFYHGLKQIKFVERLIKAIEEARNSDNNEKLKALLEIAISVAENWRLKKCLLTVNFISFCVDFRESYDKDVILKLWKLTGELCGSGTIADFEPLCPAALKIVTGNSDPQILEYCLEFCVRLIRMNSNKMLGSDMYCLAKSLCEICRNYKNCSIILRSATRVIVAALESDETRYGFDECLTFIAEHAVNEGLLSAFMMDAARKIKIIYEDSDLESKLISNEKFSALCDGPLLTYIETIECSSLRK